MKSFWNFLHKVGDILHLPDMPNWLVGVIALVIILRVPSFLEPYYYGDEMIYLTLGQGVRQGLTLYKDIHDNKPPLLYLTAAVADNLFWFKVILALWSVVTIFFFYRLSERLFEGNGKAQKISTTLFALLTTLPLLEGNTVNAELFMIGFTIIGLLLLFKEKLTIKKTFFAGVLFGLATLFKVPAMFDAPVIVFYWLITSDFKKEWKDVFKNTLVLIAGFLLPILLTFVWYFFKGALPEYIKAAFLQNVGYISSFRPGDVQKPFLVRNAPLLIRGLVVLVGLLITYIFRKKLTKKFILLTVWTLLTLFAVALSERPYPHYFIQSVAPVSFLLAMFFTDQSLEQSLVVIPLALSFFVPVYYKFYYYPTTAYYVRFLNFVSHKITKEEYFASFDPKTERNYQIGQFLMDSSKKSDRVFMWDPDSPTVYALSRRLPPIKYVVPYHVNDYSNRTDAAKLIAANPPKFIILTSDNPYPELGSLLSQEYIFIEQIGNANIYSRVVQSP